MSAERSTPSVPHEELLAAAEKLAAAHRRVIEAVTPSHSNWSGDREEYDARFSAWHSASYALRDLIGERKQVLVYCKICHKTHAVAEDEVPCGTNAWVPK